MEIWLSFSYEIYDQVSKIVYETVDRIDLQDDIVQFGVRLGLVYEYTSVECRQA